MSSFLYIIYIIPAIIKLMKQGVKRASQHLQMPLIRKSQSTRKNDIFDEFQDSRQILKKDKDNLSNNKLMFKTKQKEKLTSQYDDYQNQDFDDIQNSQSAKPKHKSELPAIVNQKKNQNTKESVKKLGRQSTKGEKLGSRHRNTRSEMDRSGNNTNNQAVQLGRYELEVDKKFGILLPQSMGNQAINKSNQQIRDLIKRYNEILTDLINRNMAQLTNKKKKKPATIEQSIKILQQQIKNNTKIEQLDLGQLKKLQEYKEKLEEQQNYSQKTMEEQIVQIQGKIKQFRKQIHDKKLAVQNQAKKLIPTNITASKNQNQSQVTALKQKLLTIRKQWQKNQEKLNSLAEKQTDLASKIDNLGDKDKEADQLRSNTKKTQDKSKKYQQIKKKYDAIKAHSQKTEALWATKCSVIAHENQSIKTKVKNMDLQVKNVEESSKLAYQKSTKFLNASKPKNEAQQKAMEKIISQMNSYSQQNVQVQRQMSLSQMKIMSKKKNSVDQSNNKQLQQKGPVQQHAKKQRQAKTQSQQNQRNRIWKQQTQHHEKNQDKTHLKNQKTSRNSLKPFEKTMTEENKPDDKHNQIITIKKQQKQSNELQIEKQENKPKKFNFSRNKTNSQLQTVNENDVNQNQSTINIKDSKTEQMQLKINRPANITENPSMINKVQKQKAQNNDQQQIKPKRFNLNLRDRKSKQQNSGYLPSSQQNNISDVAENKKQSEPQENRQLSKPTFNLRKNRQSQGKEKLSLDNQFMGQ